jgi:hypothetical protein
MGKNFFWFTKFQRFQPMQASLFLGLVKQNIMAEKHGRTELHDIWEGGRERGRGRGKLRKRGRERKIGRPGTK